MKNHQINFKDMEGFTFEHLVASYHAREGKSLYATIRGATASYSVAYNGKVILRNATLAQAVESYNGI